MLEIRLVCFSVRVALVSRQEAWYLWSVVTTTAAICGGIDGDSRSGVVACMSVGSDVAEACHRDRRSR